MSHEAANIQTEQVWQQAEGLTVDAASGAVVGEPWLGDNRGNWFFNVPEQPHVFSAPLNLIGPNDIPHAFPGSPTLIMGHGERNDAGEWTFRDGQEVKTVVANWNAHHPEDAIDFALVCNQEGSGVAGGMDSIWHATSSVLNVSAYRGDIGQTVVNVRLPEGQDSHIPEGFGQRLSEKYLQEIRNQRQAA